MLHAGQLGRAVFCASSTRVSLGGALLAREKQLCQSVFVVIFHSSRPVSMCGCFVVFATLTVSDISQSGFTQEGNIIRTGVVVLGVASLGDVNVVQNRSFVTTALHSYLTAGARFQGAA